MGDEKILKKIQNFLLEKKIIILSGIVEIDSVIYFDKENNNNIIIDIEYVTNKVASSGDDVIINDLKELCESYIDSPFIIVSPIRYDNFKRNKNKKTTTSLENLETLLKQKQINNPNNSNFNNINKSLYDTFTRKNNPYNTYIDDYLFNKINNGKESVDKKDEFMKRLLSLR